MEGVVVDKMLFRFAMYGSIPEIFAIKVESCQKSRTILGYFFGRHKFLGAGIVKIVPNLSPLRCVSSTEKSPVRILPLGRKLLTLERGILGQIFNFQY